MTKKETSPKPLDDISKAIVSFLKGKLSITDADSGIIKKIADQQDIENFCQENSWGIRQPETNNTK